MLGDWRQITSPCSQCLFNHKTLNHVAEMSHYVLKQARVYQLVIGQLGIAFLYVKHK